MPPTPLENNVARTKALLGAGARLSDYLSASLLARVVPAEDVQGEGRVRSCLLPSELRCPKPQPTATIPCAMFLIAACAVHISDRA